MKISSLVHYKNLLDEVASQPSFKQALHLIDGTVYQIVNQEVSIPDANQEVQQAYSRIVESIDDFENLISKLQQKLDTLIDKAEVLQYQQSQEFYDIASVEETSDHILTRRLSIDSKSKLILDAHVMRATDWRFPGLIFRPALENYIEYMVPADPLYLADQRQELMAPAMQKFTHEYQQKLLTNVVNEKVTGKILSDFPDNQFGFVFAYNYFNFKPIDLIKKYLQEVYDKLRPGGQFIFTYNDCDYSHWVSLAERNFTCYTPGRVIRQYCDDTGYEIIYNHIGQGDAAWLELRKPGEIKSLRGGQSLFKTVENSK